MGPKASAYFVNELIRKSPATSDQEHLPFVLINHPSVPDRTQAILDGNQQDLIDALTVPFEKLLDLEVKQVVLPCNTIHCIFDDLKIFLDRKSWYKLV